MLSTEMPVHQIAKRGQEEIRILRRAAQGGQVSMYWKVEPNLAVGRPGQLAYHLDTWVIKRRLDELRRPIPRLIRIGDLRAIARELGQGGDTNAVKRAFEQNATTFIRAKLTYRDASGCEDTLEGYFNRYTVFYRGQALPGGRRAETVYISLNDPYYGMLNRASWRPLDFAYMRQLPPAAQRMYELVSPRIFAAIKNQREGAWIRYSDLCALAVLTRQTTRRRMQIQMAAIHRPHLAAGYFARVAYRAAASDDDQPDWIIDYAPGPRARAEFEAFNGGSARGQVSKFPLRLAPEAMRPSQPRPAAHPSKARSVGSSPAEDLARRFTEKRHGGLVVPTSRAQIDRAQQILDAVGGDLSTAHAAIDLAAAAATTDPKGFPGHIGGVLQGGFVERAIAHRDEQRRRHESEILRARERERRERYEAWCRYRAHDIIAQLNEPERRRVVDEGLPAYVEKYRYLIRLRRWSREQTREWAAPRILEEFARADEPSIDAWRNDDEEPIDRPSGPSEALQ